MRKSGAAPRKEVERKKWKSASETQNGSNRTRDNVEKQMGTHRHTDTQIHSSTNHNPNHGLLVGREDMTTSSPKTKLGDHGEKRLVQGTNFQPSPACSAVSGLGKNDPSGSQCSGEEPHVITMTRG